MLKTKPRPYQRKAIAKALPHNGFAIFGEQRTGKTLITLGIADARKPALLVIVTVKKGVKVWTDQIKEHLKITWPCEVVVTYYEQLHKHRKEFRKRFRAHGREGIMIVADESHRIKRRGSQAARITRSLGKLAEYRLALTGTPLAPRSSITRKRGEKKVDVTMGLEDAWSQFDFIDPSIFGTKDEFDATYLKKGGFRGFKVIGYKNTKKFMRLFHEHSFRRTLREVQEKKTLIKRRRVYFELDRKTRKHYNDLDRGMKTLVNGRELKLPLLVSRTQKLQQLTAGFLIERDIERDKVRVHRIGTEKLRMLQALLTDIFSKNHSDKIVICAKFIPEIEQICALVSRMGLSHQVIKGGTEFKGKLRAKVAVLQIQSGVAIDLAEASKFIMYSCGHNYIDYEQAIFRVLSYSKKQVEYIWLLARDTIDELIYEAQTKKKHFSTLVIDHYRRKK